MAKKNPPETHHDLIASTVKTKHAPKSPVREHTCECGTRVAFYRWLDDGNEWNNDCWIAEVVDKDGEPVMVGEHPVVFTDENLRELQFNEEEDYT